MKKILSILGILTVTLLIFIFLVLPKFYVVPILMYHHINNDNDTMSVTLENFQRQMDYIYKNNYKVISLDELVDKIKPKAAFRQRYVVITFDDGYEDNFTQAWPLLRRYQFPATIFLISGCIGKEDYLNWQQVREMQEAGISFGAHTRNDTYLPDLGQDKDLIFEIEGSKIDIEKRVKTKVDYFCYPIGGFNEKVKDIVKITGFKGACTTNRGNDRFNKDVFELNRIKMTNSSGRLIFWIKFSGYYNLFKPLKKPY